MLEGVAECGGGGSRRALRGCALACTSTPTIRCCCSRAPPQSGSSGLRTPPHTSCIPFQWRPAAAAARAEHDSWHCNTGCASAAHPSHGSVERRLRPAGRRSKRGGRRRCDCGGPRAWSASRRLPLSCAAHSTHLGRRRLRRLCGGRGSTAQTSPPALRCTPRCLAAACRRGPTGWQHWLCICCYPRQPPRRTRGQGVAALRLPQKGDRLLRSSGEHLPQHGGGGRVTLPALHRTASAPVGGGNAAKRSSGRSSRIDGKLQLWDPGVAGAALLPHGCCCSSKHVPAACAPPSAASGRRAQSPTHQNSLLTSASTPGRLPRQVTPLLCRTAAAPRHARARRPAADARVPAAPPVRPPALPARARSSRAGPASTGGRSRRGEKKLLQSTSSLFLQHTIYLVIAIVLRFACRFL
jgi:hypothetical protein